MNERKQKREQIIEKLKLLKSIFGEAARTQTDKENDAEELIRICYEDLKTPSFQKYLGKELFNEIVNYSVTYNNKPKITFTEKNN